MLVSGSGAILIARCVGSSVDLFLTDGQGIALNDQVPFELLQDQLLSSSVWRALCDLPISNLRLQLDAELDHFPWEMLSCSKNAPLTPLGKRFSVSRSIMGRNLDATKRLKSNTSSTTLKVLRLESSQENTELFPIENENLLDINTQNISAFLRSPGLNSWNILDFPANSRVDQDVEIALRSLKNRLSLICIEGKGIGTETLKSIAKEIADAVLVYPMPSLLCPVLGALAEGSRCSEVVSAYYAKGMVLYGDFQLAREASPMPPPTDAGYRQVTSMSFDLVSSTALINEIGSERYSVLLQEFHHVCSQVVIAHGGRPDSPQGDDGIMAYFGYPLATEGATRKAIAAGLEMSRIVAEMGLQMRVGVAVGRVAVRDGQPIGLSVHLAARIQNAAENNCVFISHETRALVDKFFDVELSSNQVAFKGIEEIQSIYKVLGEKSAVGTGASDALPVQATVVGRERPLLLLKEAFQRAVLSEGSTVLILGEPGIGKSRLLFEWRNLLKASQCRFFSIHGDPDSRSSPFHAFVLAIRVFLGIEVNAERQLILPRLVEKVPELGRDLDTVSGQLLLNLLCPNENAQKSFDNLLPDSAEKIREETLDLLQYLVGNLALEAPFCMLVDDAQWLDPSTLELINRLEVVAPKSKLLIVMTMRQEVSATWRPSLSYQTIELLRLTTQESMSLLMSDPIVAALPLSMIEKAIEKSEGVPLFIEETIKMLLAMREQSGGTCPADIQASMVPSTLQELLLTRLDQCGDAKQLAQTASVFGRDFSLVHLESVLRQLNDIAGLRELSANLATLVRNGLIYAVHAELSTVKYRFKHILFRDSAYHGLWDRDRQNLHKVVANILRSDSDELIRLQPELIALHLTEAGDYGQAIDHWEKAAKLSAVRSAHRESIHFLESALVALTNLPENAARYSKELKMRMSLAAKFIATEGYGAPKVKAAYQRALELAIQTQDHVAIHRINLGLEGYYFMRAEFDQALALAKGAYQTEGENASTWEVIQPRWAEANVNWHKGNLTHAVLLMNECLEMYSHDLHRPSSVQDPGVMCLCYSAWSYWEKGDAQEAFRRIEQAVLLSQQLGHSFSQGIAHGFLASIHLFTGNLTAALREAKVSQSLCEESGFRVWLAHSRMIKGRALVGLGEIELGLTEMQTAYTLWTDTGAIVTRPLYLALQADAFLNIQQFETAMGLIDEGISIAQATGEHYHKGELLRLKAKALMLSSSSAESLAIAQTLLMDAIALAKFQGKNLFVLRSVIDLLRLPLQAEQKLWAQAELESVVTLLEAMAIAGNDKRFLLPEIIAARQLLDNEKTLGLV